jgi:hypothetical protein
VIFSAKIQAILASPLGHTVEWRQSRCRLGKYGELGVLQYARSAADYLFGRASVVGGMQVAAGPMSPALVATFGVVGFVVLRPSTL